MTQENVKDLLPLYAVDALDGEERRAVEAYLRTASPDEQQELVEWREIAASLPLALPEQAPPPALRARLLERIAEAEPSTARVLPFAPPQKSAPRLRQWLPLAAAIALACVSAWLFWQNLQILRERDQLAGKLASIQQDWNLFLSGTTRIVALKGVETPQANAKVVWDTRQQAWKIYILDLPAPPPDKDYQLWYVTKDQKVSASVFRTDPAGRKILELTLPPQVVNGLAATAVTLEPKGGSPQPTGSFYLMGQI
ncbi:MAG: anti-sigma factor [Blastocatellia bacterium]|nr:anti-sigma factor [Blastocatellia bacterium]